MAQFIFTNNHISKTGKTAISANVFDQLVSGALTHLPDINMSQKMMKRNQNIRLNRPVQTKIINGIAHIRVVVDLKKGTKPQDACTLIQDEVVKTLMASAETVPFYVHVRVESFIE